jgi:ABC-type lipoprotein release transport system permease subunit
VNEILIGADVPRRLGVSVGDTVELRIRNDRRRARVVGVKSDVVLSEAVMALPALQSLLEMEEQATGMFLAFPDTAAAGGVAARIRSLDFVGRVTSRAELVDEFSTLLADIRKLVLLVAIVALAVAVVFITANLNMAIAEQATEFSTLWALGYDRATTTRIVIVNSAAQATLALLLAVPLTAMLAGVLNRLASRAWFDQTTYLSPLLVPIVGMGVMALTLGGTMIAFRRFWGADLLENLRTRSIQ